VAAIEGSRAAEAVLDSLQANIDDVDAAREAFGFLESLTVAGYDISRLLARGLIQRICQAMSHDAHDDPDDLNWEGPDPRLQLDGTRLLIYVSVTQRFIAEMVTQRGLIDAILNNVSAAQYREQVIRLRKAKKAKAAAGAAVAAPATPAEPKAKKERKSTVERDKYGKTVGSLANKVMSVMTKKPQSMKQIKEAAGVTNNFYNLMTEMQEKGFVQKGAQGGYMLA
jgi:hypothetical protein